MKEERKEKKALWPGIEEFAGQVDHCIRPGMAATLTVAMVSPILEIGNKSANLDKFIGYVKEAAAQGADIVLFPETALTGYIGYKSAGWDRPLSEIRKWAETIPGPSVDRLIAAAREYNIYIILGMFEADSEYVGRLYNSAAFVGPEGLVGTYRKNHIVDNAMFSASQQGLGSGLQIPVWEIRQGWRISIPICYDLVMPEVPRIAAVKGADLILCPSCCPLQHQEAFFPIILVRAMENQTGVAWTNNAGTYFGPGLPDEGATLGGNRMAVEATGEVLLKEGSPDTEGMSLATFTAENLYLGRGLMPQLRDRKPEAYQALIKPKELARDIIPYKLRPE